MKRRFLITGYLLVGCVLSSACAAKPVARRPAQDGSAISGGGNGHTSEFHRLVRMFHFAAVKSVLDLGLERPLPREAFDALMGQIRIQATTQPLTLRGESVEAINYPKENRIVFFSPSWERKEKIDKFRLAVHEVLGLLAVPDPGYSVSDKIVARSRQILTSVGVEFSGPGKNDELMYTSVAGDPVVCEVRRAGNWRATLVEFLLQPGGGVAAEKAKVEAGIWMDFMVSYGEDQQVHLRLAKNNNPVGGGTGQTIADFTINYIGSFRDIEAWVGDYYLSCRLSSVK